MNMRRMCVHKRIPVKKYILTICNVCKMSNNNVDYTTQTTTLTQNASDSLSDERFGATSVVRTTLSASVI